MEKLILPGIGGGYARQLQPSLQEITLNMFWRFKALVFYWDNDYSKLLRNVGGLLLLIPAAWGFLQNNIPSKRLPKPSRPTTASGAATGAKPSFLGLAVLGYLGVLAIWTADDKRYLVPLFPAFVFYVLLAIDSLATHGGKIAQGKGDSPIFVDTKIGTVPKIGPSIARAVFSLFLLFVVVSYAGFYFVTPYGPMKDGVESPAAVELFSFLREKTSPHETCIFSKPRALALYAERRASAYPLGEDEKQFWQYADSIDATLIIVGVGQKPREPGTIERVFVDAPPSRAAQGVARKSALPEIYRNSAFRVYRLAKAKN